MLDGARKILLDEYYGNREIVAVSPHYAAYADEKYRHSLQVLGAGNFIIRHEPWFAGPGEKSSSIWRKRRCCCTTLPVLTKSGNVFSAPKVRLTTALREGKN